MAGLKFSSFGAATMPLSKIVVDSNLQLYPYDLIADNVRGKSAPIPYNPHTWPTKILDWGDTAEELRASTTGAILTWTNTTGRGTKIYAHVLKTAQYSHTFTLSINDVNLETSPGLMPGGTYTSGAYWANPGDVVKITGGASGELKIYTTGEWGLPVPFSLEDHWLALDGCNFQGIDVTITIPNVNGGEPIPYSDYEKYFPMQPVDIDLGAPWSPTQIRPTIMVYNI